MTENAKQAVGSLIAGILALGFRRQIAYFYTRLEELFVRVITFGRVEINSLHTQTRAAGILLLVGIASICFSVFRFLVEFGIIEFGTKGGSP
jgi:hypothetical protein